MRHNLTSSDEIDLNQQWLLDYRMDQTNNAHLRKVLEKLINKSKSILQVLQATILRLENVERQKDYWKTSYLCFRQICHKYIDAEGLMHFKEVVQLRKQLQKLQTQKQCLMEQSRFNTKLTSKYSRNYQNSSPMPDISHSFTWQQQRRQKDNKNESTGKHHSRQTKQKSISTISFQGSPLRSEHHIKPKKKLIKIQTKKTDQNP